VRRLGWRIEHRAWRWALVTLCAASAAVGTAAGLGWARSPARSAARLPAGYFEQTFDATSFVRGNLHAHTNRSDGDSSPEEVIAWYRRHGYAFLAISDHNRFFDPRRFPSLQNDGFRLVSGEEITMRGAGRQVHVNAVCTRQRIGGGTFRSAAEALAWASAEVARQDGVAIVNHPNFDRALRPPDVLAAERAPLIEIMSRHPYVYSAGTAERPPAEIFWDYALGAGLRRMAVAVDDMHHLRAAGGKPARAGGAWIEVFATQPEPSAICEALRRGRLYATTGALVRRIKVSESTYSIWTAVPDSVVVFLGHGGEELARLGPMQAGGVAAYQLRGGELYVRARISSSAGQAWTPAIFVQGSD
jgi:hypothetical protein